MGRRYPPLRWPDDRTCKIGPGPYCVPGILLPRKITVKGAPYGRVFDGAKTAPPLTLIFPGKTIGIYRKDGAERGVP